MLPQKGAQPAPAGSAAEGTAAAATRDTVLVTAGCGWLRNINLNVTQHVARCMRRTSQCFLLKKGRRSQRLKVFGTLCHATCTAKAEANTTSGMATALHAANNKAVAGVTL
jgi:hypothetical protein